MLGVDPVGREELIAAHDGRVLWHGVKGEQVLAVNDGFAVIRSADHGTLRCRAFATGRTAWSRAVGAGASAALSPYAVAIVTTKPAGWSHCRRRAGRCWPMCVPVRRFSRSGRAE